MYENITRLFNNTSHLTTRKTNRNGKSRFKMNLSIFLFSLQISLSAFKLISLNTTCILTAQHFADYTKSYKPGVWIVVLYVCAYDCKQAESRKMIFAAQKRFDICI
ncbi:hypothetical protein ANTPLA_LOCUS5466 [Anthophora plagiata]